MAGFKSVLFEVVLSTERCQQPKRFSQLSLYNVTLPMAFFGLALCWAWAFRSFFCSFEAGALSALCVVVQLAAVVLACAVVFLSRFSMRLRYLYQITLACSCVLVPLEIVGGGGGFIALCLSACVAGMLATCLLLLWMHHLGKFWRYRYTYGIAVSLCFGAGLFSLSFGLQSPYGEVAHAVSPLFSLACWRYLSYFSKGAQASHSSSDNAESTLLPRISPISVGLGLAFGFLFASEAFLSNLEFSPLVLAFTSSGCMLGAIAYVVAVRLSLSYLRTGRAYQISAISLIVICLGCLLFPERTLLCMVVLVGAFSWTGMALFVSLTAAVARNPRKQIYSTSCCGFLWLPFGLACGMVVALVLNGLFAVDVADFPAIAMVYVVLLSIVVLFPMLPSNLVPDYEEAAGPGGFVGRCSAVAKEHSLSARETEVMVLLARGKTAKRIAEELVVSPATVHTHVAHIYRKMGINSKAELLDAIEAKRG